MAEFVNYDGSKPTIAFVQQGAYLYGTGSSDRFMAIAPGAVAVVLMASLFLRVLALTHALPDPHVCTGNSVTVLLHAEHSF
jgi:hypothetical protein